MLKRLFLAILVIASLLAIGYTLFKAEEKVEQKQDIATAIPEDALLLFEVDNLQSLWDKVKDGNIIWEELGFTDMVTDLSELGSSMDSSLFHDPAWASYLDGNKTFCSIHSNGGDEVHSLLAFVLRRDVETSQLKSFFNEQAGTERSYKDKVYEGTTISSLDSSETYFCTHNGFLLFSSSQVLLERSVRSINTGQGLLIDSGFKKIRATAGKSHLCYAYLNYLRFSDLANMMRRKNGHTPFFENFAQWSEFDVSIKSNALLMSGLLTAQDSLSSYLSLFRDQETIDMDALSFVPANVADFLFIGLSDKRQFDIRHEDYLHSIGRYNKTQQVWDDLDKAYGLSKEQVLESVGNQLVMGHIEGAPVSEQTFCLIEIAEDAALLESKVISWNDEYRGVKKGEVQDCRFLEATFGRFLGGLSQAYVAQMDGYLALANSERTLKSLVNFKLSERSLKNDEGFQEFQNDLSGSSSLCYYLDISRSPDILEQQLESELASEVSEHKDVFRKFQAVCIQYEHARNDLYYQNLYLKYNPIYKKETSSLWEAELDTTFSDKIWSVTNHVSGHQDIAVQDDSDKLYLISNTGKERWSRQIDEEIRSDIHQIDVYKNGRLQLLFNTDTKIYLIDRLGRDVEGYPISLPAKATSVLGLMDYDKNKKYRLLIATAEGMVHNFDAEGRAVKGWEYKMRGKPVVGHITHFSISGKDYITCIDSDGDLFFLDRTGKVRHDSDMNISAYAGSKYRVTKGPDISRIRLHYFKNDGKFWSQMAGEEESLSFDLTDGQVLDWSSKGEYYLLNGDEIERYTGLDEPTEKVTLQEECESLQVIQNMNNVWLVTQAASGNTYLQSSDGQEVSGFPIAGSTRAILRDMDGDGNSEIIIGDADGILYMYSLSL